MANIPTTQPTTAGSTYSGIGLEINGINLHTHTGGKAAVLAVTGRETITPKLDATARQGLDGSRVESWALDARTLTVEILMQDYETTARALNSLLFGELALRFLDDPGWTYQGYLQTHSRPRNDRKSQVTSLVFYCPDPWARSAVKTSTGAIASSSTYPVILESIQATVTSGRTQLTITSNRGYNLTVAGAITTGQVYLIRWQPQTPMITVNGADASNRLTLASSYLEIRDRLRHGDSLTAVGATLSVKYYERRP